MHPKYVYILATFLLLGCGSPAKNPYGGNGSYGMINNTKEFGVVVNVHESEDVDLAGTATTVAGHAYYAGMTTAITPQAALAMSNTPGALAGAAAAGTSNALNTLATDKTWFGSITNYFTTGSAANPDTPNNVILVYEILKTDGQKIIVNQLPEQNEPILYPGQKCSIQYNGKFTRVYPADVENPLPRRGD